MGEGLTGRTYALPTMEGEAASKAAAAHFLDVAAALPHLTFLLTKVGCGIAGHDEERVKHWSADAPDHVVRPPGW